jgi:N-acetylmuramoyl-L-alanine amidase
VAEDLKKQILSPFKLVITPELSIPGVIDYVNRTLFAMPAQGSILIALHMNEGPPAASGVEVVYPAITPSIREYQASQLAKEFAARVGLPVRHSEGKYPGTVKDSETPQGAKNGGAGLPMLRKTKCPAFILEAGFISNHNDTDAVMERGGSALALSLRKLWEEGLFS